MGLLNTPAFETETTTSAASVFAAAPQVDVAATPVVTAPVAAPVAAAVAVAQGTAVAVAQTTALAIAVPAYAISEGMKNAVTVEFNTFPQITTTNGNFVERETKTVLGDTLHFELLSFQDSFVVDPGDDKAPKEMVRYSDDGVTCSDGTPVAEHLVFLKAGGYPNAGLKKRSVVVGEVISASKTKKYDNELVQFDLSPMSRVEWTRYLANSVNALRKNRKTEEQLKMIVATANLATKGDNTFTKASFASLEVATA